MKRYTIFHPFIWSFFSKSLYQDVAQKWTGVCFLYLFLLLAISWIPIMYVLDSGAKDFSKTTGKQIIQSVPEVKVSDGIVSIDRPVPHLINTDSGETIAIIDTSGAYSNLSQTSAPILVTKNKIMVKQDDGQMRVYDIPENMNFSFGPPQLEKGLGFIGHWLAASVYPVAVIFSFIYRVLQVLIYAAIGNLILCRMFEVKLEYQQVLRMAVIAITPAVLISTVLSILGVYFPFEWVCYFLLSMLYLSFGIKSNRGLQ